MRLACLPRLGPAPPRFHGDSGEDLMPSFTHAQHVGLTVRDREQSAEWYQRVLGFRLVKKFDTGIPRVLLHHPESHFLVGLYNHADGAGDPFSPLRTGLDHIALAV